MAYSSAENESLEGIKKKLKEEKDKKATISKSKGMGSDKQAPKWNKMKKEAKRKQEKEEQEKQEKEKGDVKSYESLTEKELQELHGLTKIAISKGEPAVIYKGTSYKASGAFLTEVDNRIIKLQDSGKKQSEEKSPQQPVKFDQWTEQNKEVIVKNKWDRKTAQGEYDKYVTDFKSKQQNQQQQNKGKNP